MAHKHSVRDMGAHFLIDQFTRQIKNASANKTTIVQYDHNSERLTFEIPLYVDGHAMTLCDLIEIHYINISADGNSQNHGTYEVNDIKAEGETAVFTWLISQECTQLAGSLNFFIVFKCTESGVTVYRWGTEIYKNLPISEGMDNGEAVLTEYPDILAQWKAQIFGAQDASVLAVEEAKTSALAAIEAAGEAKKQSVLDSIPDEYEALSALADQNHRNKAGAIVLETEGESITMNDASEYPLQNLKLFGKSTQDGTPTPDAPVDIVSVENPVVAVCGKNLWNHENDTVDMAQLSGWGSAIWRTNAVIQALRPNTTYTMRFTVTCLSVPEYETMFSDDCGFVLYSAKESGKFITLAMSKGEGALSVGEKRTATCTFTTPDNVNDVSMGYEILRYVQRYKQADGTAVYATAKFEDVQLELGDKASEYEPYNGGVLETAHTLPGIPVSGGGNYTDENGQEWICDEVDLARGVYVQRIGQITLDNSRTYYYNADTNGKEFFYTAENNNVAAWETRMYCSHFPVIGDGVGMESDYWTQFSGSGGIRFRHKNLTSLDELTTWLISNAVHVRYVLTNPIETPLSDAEINAFRALRSNRPNTVILNDAGAHMVVSYVADTKTYIDNKIKELMEGVME